MCLEKGDRRSKRLENKPKNYSEIIPTPTSLIGLKLAKKDDHDEDYIPPEQCVTDIPSEQRPRQQVSGHKRTIQDTRSLAIKRVKPNSRKIPPQFQRYFKLNSNRRIPPPFNTDIAHDDSKIQSATNPSWSLQQEALLRGAVYDIVGGVYAFRELPIVRKAIIGIALMNEIIRGSDNDLKSFPMCHRPTVRAVLVKVGGGKPAQYACSGVLLGNRVRCVPLNPFCDEQILYGYLADPAMIEVVRRNIMKQQDIKKKIHCQRVIKCFEDAMKAMQVEYQDILNKNTDPLMGDGMESEIGNRNE
eukprot:567776_1